MTHPSLVDYAGAALFFLAVVHTFSTKWFAHLATMDKRNAGLWHLLSEVEVVFGLWAFVLLAFMAVTGGAETAVRYLDRQNFTEPLFVFVILVMAGTRPILEAAQKCLTWSVRFIPLPEPFAYYFLSLSMLPLLGSLITEPAAITLAALMLRDRFYSKLIPPSMKYLTLAVLFVNVSIGGVLTSYAAPPVLMVADKWEWNSSFMSYTFGWKAVVAIVINAVAASWIFRKVLLRMEMTEQDVEKEPVPFAVILIHVLFLMGTVFFSHHPAVFMGLFLFFLGFTEAYPRHQQPLMLREGLLVAFFLAGLVVLGEPQRWWLQPLLAGMDSHVLFLGAAFLTAITDNAALTYLGSLVDGISDASKYALVAGAVTGGGLTVIANAPNPVGFSILKACFDEGAISPLRLFTSALPPTIVALLCFWLL